MGKFLESEKPRQVAFKLSSSTISPAAREEGEYKHHFYPFCLPCQYAAENLYPPIRDSIRAYFKRHGIRWHDGQNGDPSNHLCSSQVCCVNFLAPFADQPEALATLLCPVFPALQEMLPIEDGRFVAFEWIGEKNYLGEGSGNNTQRTRGANYTSADAAVRFKRQDGLEQICLIEWKYTESYSSNSLAQDASGRRRIAIYSRLYADEGCPLDKTLIPGFDALFYEPFYQLMRQQLLAHEMDNAHELGADVVSLLHISPDHNRDFKKVTSPAICSLGNSPTDIWKRLVMTPDRFIAVSAEDLFGPFDVAYYRDLTGWKDYIFGRYAWMSM